MRHRRANLLWQCLSLAGALAWLAWFVLTLRLPEYDGRAGIYLQIASIIGGISLLGGLLLLSTRPRWSALARIVMFCLGLGWAFLAWKLQLKDALTMGLVALALLCIALPVGYWIGNQVERLSHLIPLCIALSLADIYSVWQGPSRQAVQQIAQYQSEVGTAAAQGGAEAVRAVQAPLWGYFVAHMPLAGSGQSAPVLGVGDFIVLAFLLRTAWLSGIPAGRLLLAALLSTFVALASSQLSGLALPALPFIALGTVGWLYLTEPRMRGLGRQEILLSFGVFVLFGVLIALKALR